MATKAGKKRMTHSEVINHFADSSGLKRAQVKEFFEEMATLAAREVKSNGEFVLPGFGKLVKSERKAREGRNPATGETIQIPAKTTLKFRVGKAMKDTVLPKKKILGALFFSKRRRSQFLTVVGGVFVILIRPVTCSARATSVHRALGHKTARFLE